MKHSFRKLPLLALGLSVAAATIAVPAQARNGAAYFGAGFGYTDPEAPIVHSFGSKDKIKEKDGWEGEVYVGEDWGAIRTEAEVAYAHFRPRTFVHLSPAPGFTVPLRGHNNVTTTMLNALYDIGGEDGGIALALGAGAGRAWLSTRDSTPVPGVALSDSDSAWAYQLVAQARLPLSRSVEIGLKYKYLNTKSFHLHDAAGDPHWVQLATSTALASLIVNFGGEAPPPPPPPPPQTKTCPDGSSVDINADCPVPPPPPVQPTGERG